MFKSLEDPDDSNSHARFPPISNKQSSAANFNQNDMMRSLDQLAEDDIQESGRFPDSPEVNGKNRKPTQRA